MSDCIADLHYWNIIFKNWSFCTTLIWTFPFFFFCLNAQVNILLTTARKREYKKRNDQWESQLNYRLSTLEDDFIRKVKKQLKWTGEKIFLFRNIARTPIILNSLETSAGHFHFYENFFSPSFFFFGRW